MKVRWLVVALFLVGLGLTYWIFRLVPTAFVPDEDQGYLIIIIQAPAGASLDYTTKIAARRRRSSPRCRRSTASSR